MEKEVIIEGRKIGLKATAGTVCTYRDIFGRDLLKDMALFEKELLSNKTLSSETAGVAEKAIWVMAKEYDPSVPPIKEWLDNFSPYFVYNVCVHALNMWIESTKTLNTSKKK